MVCFDILVAYPYAERYVQNTMNEKQLEHLRRHYNADFLGGWIDGGIQFFELALCDRDAIGFLRDVPSSVYCVSVKILRTDTFLYSFYKATGMEVKPPRNPLLKEVYWAASQLERRRQDPHKIQKLGI